MSKVTAIKQLLSFIWLSVIILTLAAVSIPLRKTGVHYLLLSTSFAALVFLTASRLKLLAIALSVAAFLAYLALDLNRPFIPNPGINYPLANEIFASLVLLTSLSLYLLAAKMLNKKHLLAEEAEKKTLFKAYGHKVTEAKLNNHNQNLNKENSTLTRIVTDKTRTLQTFLEAINVNIPLSITDPEGLIIQVNGPFTELCQYTEEELLGKNHNIINSGTHRDEFFGEFWNTISAGKKWKGELSNRAKDGSNYWVDIVVIPLLNHEGEIQQFISLQFPITNRKQVQSQKDIYIRSLEEMAFITSHKIRKPVTNIKGIIDVIENIDLDLVEFDKIKEYLKTSSQELEDFTFELNDFIYNQIKSETEALES